MGKKKRSGKGEQGGADDTQSTIAKNAALIAKMKVDILVDRVFRLRGKSCRNRGLGRASEGMTKTSRSRECIPHFVFYIRLQWRISVKQL
ncbi:hypothetical protein FJTKL_12092 [Diaporthe vaccinii]|uniref:Uncharacterized protein n=1 Tax=Diaporthe vaccinii TaxID=105482 RepID=A0ABR4EF48_9PEZI